MKQGVIVFYDNTPGAVYTDGAIDPANGVNSKSVFITCPTAKCYLLKCWLREITTSLVIYFTHCKEK